MKRAICREGVILFFFFLGIVIGTIVIAMFMPMFSLGEMVG